MASARHPTKIPANKYGKLHYSTKAYPSPALNDEEWEIIFRAATEENLDIGISYTKDDEIKPWTTYWKENYNYDVVCCCVDCGQGEELDGLRLEQN